MLKEKNNQVLLNLIEATKSGNLNWKETSSPDKREYQRTMSATGEDGSIFEIEIKYIVSGDKFILESMPSMWIRNPILPGGFYLISTANSDFVFNIRDVVKEIFCTDFNPTTQTLVDKLEVINRGISLETYRENKLNDIL